MTGRAVRAVRAPPDGPLVPPARSPGSASSESGRCRPSLGQSGCGTAKRVPARPSRRSARMPVQEPGLPSGTDHFAAASQIGLYRWNRSYPAIRHPEDTPIGYPNRPSNEGICGVVLRKHLDIERYQPRRHPWAPPWPPSSARGEVPSDLHENEPVDETFWFFEGAGHLQRWPCSSLGSPAACHVRSAARIRDDARGARPDQSPTRGSTRSANGTSFCHETSQIMVAIHGQHDNKTATETQPVIPATARGARRVRCSTPTGRQGKHCPATASSTAPVTEPTDNTATTRTPRRTTAPRPSERIP